MKHNDDLVLDIIKNNTKSLTAYEILNKVQKVKKIQPMSVYRSLKNLQDLGKIHKSNQNKSFLLCKEGEYDHKHNPVLVICKECGKAEELEVNSLDRKSTRLNSSHTDSSRMPSSA